ncbi:hypothetical protein VIN30_04165 [Adlercreutzia sp. R7]|uniref:DUF2779 domain-containing protein n=1 Tax=Adlercreutzia wanghongyangiae TaxID=3111451 RepID=A0ABU6IGS3_9ACTN|nr:hypothetical protein [Adlercreutzia sp. R7]
MHFSKSKYTSGVQRPKICWMQRHMPELDYHRLEGIHNGGEASNAFQYLAEHTPTEQTLIREQLLRYCELDTLAMVRIWEKLREVAE